MKKTSPTVKKLDFPQALKKVIEGKKIQRKSWENQQEYGLLKDGWLMIFKTDGFHRWMVNDGDLLSDDWVVFESN